MRPPITLYLADIDATAALATRLAGLLAPGDAVLLDGPLGAGKSEFVRLLLRAAAEDPLLDVPSPTFTLVQSYDIPAGTVHHFDLYRLTGPADLAELGWDEARHDIVLVEWPDRLGSLAPGNALRILLAQGSSDNARIATLSGWDARIGALVT